MEVTLTTKVVTIVNATLEWITFIGIAQTVTVMDTAILALWMENVEKMDD